MCNIILRYGLMVIVAFALPACSHMEYAATKNHYHITTAKDSGSVKTIAQSKTAEADLPALRQPKTTQVLSITKKDTKSLGNIYLPNGFAADQEDLVFEIKREKRSYKAVTPFLFDSSDFNSHLALSVNSRTAVTAGLEFKIPFGKVK